MALWALPRCWVQLVGVSGGEKIYLGSSIIITIDPTLSLAIGGQDGMDGGGGHWMTCSIIRTCHLSWVLPQIWHGVSSFPIVGNHINSNCFPFLPCTLWSASCLFMMYNTCIYSYIYGKTYSPLKAALKCTHNSSSSPLNSLLKLLCCQE